MCIFLCQGESVSRYYLCYRIGSKRKAHRYVGSGPVLAAGPCLAILIRRQGTYQLTFLKEQGRVGAALLGVDILRRADFKLCSFNRVQLIIKGVVGEGIHLILSHQAVFGYLFLCAKQLLEEGNGVVQHLRQSLRNGHSLLSCRLQEFAFLINRDLSDCRIVLLFYSNDISAYGAVILCFCRVYYEMRIAFRSRCPLFIFTCCIRRLPISIILGCGRLLRLRDNSLRTYLDISLRRLKLDQLILACRQGIRRFNIYVAGLILCSGDKLRGPRMLLSSVVHALGILDNQISYKLAFLIIIGSHFLILIDFSGRLIGAPVIKPCSVCVKNQVLNAFLQDSLSALGICLLDPDIRIDLLIPLDLDLVKCLAVSVAVYGSVFIVMLHVHNEYCRCAVVFGCRCLHNHVPAIGQVRGFHNAALIGEHLIREISVLIGNAKVLQGYGKLFSIRSCVGDGFYQLAARYIRIIRECIYNSRHTLLRHVLIAKGGHVAVVVQDCLGQFLIGHIHKSSACQVRYQVCGKAGAFQRVAAGVIVAVGDFQELQGLLHDLLEYVVGRAALFVLYIHLSDMLAFILYGEVILLRVYQVALACALLLQIILSDLQLFHHDHVGVIGYHCRILGAFVFVTVEIQICPGLLIRSCGLQMDLLACFIQHGAGLILMDNILCGIQAVGCSCQGSVTLRNRLLCLFVVL